MIERLTDEECLEIMNKLLGVEQFQEYSEVELFNKIGFMASTLGYVPVYFKVLHPKLVGDISNYEFEYKYMHYIHLCKEDGMKISIYYDKYNLGAMFPEQPYYELYDRCDIERFLDTEEDKGELLNRLSKLLK